MEVVLFMPPCLILYEGNFQHFYSAEEMLLHSVIGLNLLLQQGDLMVHALSLKEPLLLAEGFLLVFFLIVRISTCRKVSTSTQLVKADWCGKEFYGFGGGNADIPCIRLF